MDYIEVESALVPGELTLAQHKLQLQPMISDYDAKAIELFRNREVALRRLARLQSELSVLESLAV